ALDKVLRLAGLLVGGLELVLDRLHAVLHRLELYLRVVVRLNRRRESRPRESEHGEGQQRGHPPRAHLNPSFSHDHAKFEPRPLNAPVRTLAEHAPLRESPCRHVSQSPRRLAEWIPATASSVPTPAASAPRPQRTRSQRASRCARRGPQRKGGVASRPRPPANSPRPTGSSGAGRIC